jgi:ubiquinone/menaquinone biosynthesis C-methylase UbiE
VIASEAEGETERAKRRHQRVLFDGVARLYQATRPGYPPELAAFVAQTAAVGAGDQVLEVGCGTGQLTASLLPHRFALTAIDIGASMIEVAREQFGGDGVTFLATPFEELDAAPGTFGLVIAGAAFHWIEPEVRFRKAARLLRPGGWLAVAGYDERYDDPLGAELDDMWLARADNDGAWVTRRANGEVISGSGLFGPSARRTFTERISRSAADVIGVENTRATSLSWPEAAQREFSADLRAGLERLGRLEPGAQVGVTVETSVTMAPVLAAAAGA